MLFLPALAPLRASAPPKPIAVAYQPRLGTVLTYDYSLALRSGRQSGGQVGRISVEATKVAPDGTVTVRVKLLGIQTRNPGGQAEPSSGDQEIFADYGLRGRSGLAESSDQSPFAFISLLQMLPERDLAKGETAAEAVTINGGKSTSKVQLTGFDGRSVTFQRALKQDDVDVRIESKVARDGSGLIEGRISLRGKAGSADVAMKRSGS